jgi:hypothetical protein
MSKRKRRTSQPSDDWTRAPRWMTVQAVTQYTGLSLKTIAALVLQGKIRVQVNKDDVLDYLLALAQATEGERWAKAPELLTVEEAAELSGIDASVIQQLSDSGDLDTHLDGRVEKQSLAEWIQVLAEIYSGQWDLTEEDPASL